MNEKIEKLQAELLVLDKEWSKSEAINQRKYLEIRSKINKERKRDLVNRQTFGGYLFSTSLIPFSTCNKMEDCFAVLVSKTGSAHDWDIYIEAQRLGKPIVFMDDGKEVEILNRIWKEL